ncbi:hypothetical protein J437_LFUL016161 [Ladona fulva]|uniref:Integrase catalytic domain-containing protein n=1 Tax=Ladona fulva TaxID=123851 RepID=A0A8K0P6L5_LADFU|nr:hypothetical protein J437_LFUL016161 [Ladona fulva]
MSRSVLVASTHGSLSSSTTISHLRKWFATHGLLDEIVTDNGLPFRSEVFKDYLRMNAIEHHLTPAYHPSSNGLAERTVQTVKHLLAYLPDKD